MFISSPSLKKGLPLSSRISPQTNGRQSASCSSSHPPFPQSSSSPGEMSHPPPQDSSPSRAFFSLVRFETRMVWNLPFTSPFRRASAGRMQLTSNLHRVISAIPILSGCPSAAQAFWSSSEVIPISFFFRPSGRSSPPITPSPGETFLNISVYDVSFLYLFPFRDSPFSAEKIRETFLFPSPLCPPFT